MDTNFNYSYDGITYSGVKRPGITMGGYPFGMKDNYEIDGENISKIKHLVFNAIDIDWNGAVLPNKGETINTTSDLLNVIDKVEEVDVSGLAETFATKKELTQTEETISETISALNDTVDKKVDWVESVSGRNHIVLKNHDSILGTATDGQTYNVAMISKWDVADFGTNKLHTNLNTSDAVTINDDKVIATTDQLDSMASGLLTTINSVVQAVSGKASTEYVDTKISDLIGAAPAELDTLKEIADRLATDNNALSGLFDVIGTKANSKDVFTKEEATSLMDEKDLVIASALNDLDSKKANVEDVYTKEEANNTFLTEIPEVDLSEYATLTYVDDKVEQIVGTAPENFDTLEELAEVVKDLPKVVDIESVEGIKYTQDEIDDAQEGDEAYGKTTSDWKVEPVEEVSHPMTISEFVTTSMESVNEKPQVEALKTKYNALLSLLNIADADVNSVIVNKQLEGSNNVVFSDGYVNNIETSASTTGIKTITANLGQENVEDLQMTTLTLGAPKSVTINNTGDHVVDLNVNAPETGTSTPTVTIKDGDFDRIQLENASLTVQDDATVHAIEITPKSKKNVTINCVFVEQIDKETNTVHPPTIINNSNYDVNITLNNKNEEASDIVVDAPNSTVTLNGGKWKTLEATVSDNTLIIKKNAKIGNLIVNHGNVKVQVARESDIVNVITGKIMLGDPKASLVVDHTNFAEARQNELVDYYNNYPTEANQDGDTWPAFTPSKFPWLVINHEFDGNTEVVVYYQGEKVFGDWKPSAQVQQESGNMVNRTYAILSVPEDCGLTQFTETAAGNEVLLNPEDIEVRLINANSTIDYIHDDITSANISKLTTEGTHTLTEDITKTGNFSVGIFSTEDMVWDLAGHTLTCQNTRGYGNFVLRGSAHLEINDSTRKVINETTNEEEIITGKVVNTANEYGFWTSTPNSKLVINGGEFEAATHVLYAEKGEIIVNGGSFKLTNPEEAEKDQNGNFKFLLNCYDANYTNQTASIKVKGGKFYGFNPDETYGEPGGPVSYLATDETGKKLYKSVPTNETYEYGTVYEVLPISE